MKHKVISLFQLRRLLSIVRTEDCVVPTIKTCRTKSQTKNVTFDMSHSFDDTDDDYEQPTFIAVLINEVVNVEFDDEWS